MKGKIVGLVLVVLLVCCFVFPGCSAGQIDDLEQELKEERVEKGQLQLELSTAVENLENSDALLDEANEALQKLDGECNTALEDIGKQMEAVEERNKVLEGEVIDLRQPPLNINGRCIAGTIGFRKTTEVTDKFFPDANRATSSYSSEPFQLATLEALEKFLANDHTDTKHFSNSDSPRSSCHDAVSFMMKERWINEGLPPWSFCLVKVWREVPGGSMIDWWNVFLTKENGEYIFYGIDWTSDKITKFAPGEHGEWDVCLVIISDRII